LKDKKGLGVTGTNFEPLGPKLAERAAELGYTKRGKLGRDPDAASSDSDGDTEMSDSSLSSDDDDAVVEGADFVPLNIGQKVPRFPIVDDSGEDKENETTANGVEPNPYFVVDTNPAPVVLNVNGVVKKSKKRAKEEDGEGKKSKKAKKEKDAAPGARLEPAGPEVDFAALEAKLQAEVEEAEAAKTQEAQAAESSEGKKSKKKRRRSSDGTGGVVEKKKAKKGKSKKVEDAPANSAPEPSLTAEETVAKESGKKRKLSETASGDEVVEKKVKKESKEKKRKVDADGADVDDGKKKKRKHKVGSDSE
jgi:hypothetical protein